MTNADQFQQFTESVRQACGISDDIQSDSDLGKELARVSEILWYYFQLPDDGRSRFESLILHLFDSGDEAEPQDILTEMELIYRASGHLPTSKSSQEAESLLESMIEPSSSDDDHIDGLEFESLAEFAEPLICCKKVEQNPDLIDEMMMRAHDYWYLATGTKSGRDAKLATIVTKYSQNGESPADIRTEAMMMIERFDQLYRSAGTRH
ncbi:MAG: hypothetical protein HKN43_06240 [Rhodothermales bacterium]|nr:hypothetical protein [Rhodothermales bacterium]